MHEVDAAVVGSGASARKSQHAGARVDTGDVRERETVSAGSQEVAVANARDQDALATGEMFQPGNTTLLQSRSGENLFHPGVMRRQPIEAHAKEKSRQQIPATNAPPA